MPQENYIIPIMGPTGAGKSSFINLLLGPEEAAKAGVKTGDSLQSCTTNLQPVIIPAHLIPENLPSWKPVSARAKLIVVDTPGFDDTSMDDSEILKRVADWLAKSYGNGAKLAGVIYLHDISQTRVTGATKRNFEVFEKLCGADACKAVVLGTTKWRRVPSEGEKMVAREKELEKYFWKEMLKKGSTMQRADGTGSSPWDLVETVLLKGVSPTLLIQKELTDLHKKLPQTEAAAVLRGRIDELIQSLKKAGASKAEIRALTREVNKLKEQGFFGRFFSRFF